MGRRFSLRVKALTSHPCSQKPLVVRVQYLDRPPTVTHNDHLDPFHREMTRTLTSPPHALHHHLKKGNDGEDIEYVSVGDNRFKRHTRLSQVQTFSATRTFPHTYVTHIGTQTHACSFKTETILVPIPKQIHAMRCHAMWACIENIHSAKVYLL